MINNNYFMGIDSGSTMCKTALLHKGRIIDTRIIRTGWNPKQSAEDSVKILLDKHGVMRNTVHIASTGYGREAIDWADEMVTEITCHALGGVFLAPDIQGVIDIGGQDSKVIQIQGNKVVDFLMNDKCAAGTGRFLSMACEVLGLDLDDIDKFVHSDEAISINSMCTVFAESEIISLLSMQKDRSKILAGVLDSIAQRVSQMVGRINFGDDDILLMTGGLSRSNALMDSIFKASGIKIKSHELAVFAGAIGACLSLEKEFT